MFTDDFIGLSGDENDLIDVVYVFCGNIVEI